MPGAAREAGYLRLDLAAARSSSKAGRSPLAAASAADRTNLVAFPGPAALWIALRWASLNLNANTTCGSFGIFSFLGFGSLTALAFFDVFALLPEVGAPAAASVFGVLLVVGSIVVSSVAGKLVCVLRPIPGTEPPVSGTSRAVLARRYQGHS